MRILIAAYACEPATGSEPGVGWNWSVQAARHGHHVTTITRSNNRRAIETALAESPVPNLEFAYVDLPRPLTRLKRRGGFLGLYAYYYAWQVRTGFLARRLHAARRFDLVHHVTFVNDWMPSGLTGIQAPFIWGPVGGSTHVMPKEFREPLPKRFQRYEVIRTTGQTLLGRRDPWVERTRRKARRILTYTDEALAGIPERHRHKARAIVHIGVLERDVPADLGEPPETPFTVLSGGRLVHWKGLDLLVEGFARFVEENGVDARLVLTGIGPFRDRLEQLVDLNNVAELVSFLGMLPTRDDVYRELGRSHLYALPTLRDGPPVAILEAMCAAKPILCLDVGATRELVPPSAGLKIPTCSRAGTIDGIASALAWAQSHPDELREMGAQARRYALNVHDWRRIGDEVDSIYRSVRPI